MAKITIINILICLVISNNCLAQNLQVDSIKAIAISDAKLFRLDQATLKKFKKNKNSNSDYFKPNIYTTRNITLLSDSTYVKQFREIAYNQSLKRKTTGHYVLIGGVALVGSLLIISLVALNNIHIK
ncbi:hypothetical protein DU508_12995 [Pedobacter chinensis]|uniref:Uncharacterized protein n=1 Tax=Pedobacter chinensis TaxID=2282421 RepID=A0A369Q0P4_9SPHI|nr:hypothetical protein [Pedobacter chinensis]RDC56499.1 hypothetical protein DU508_12995 [Pedobacter chinensis]